MKQSMKMGTSFFNTHRMLSEYIHNAYFPYQTIATSTTASNATAAVPGQTSKPAPV